MMLLARVFCLVAVVSAMTLARAEEALVPTVIESVSAEMISTETESVFTFRQNVVVTATNMKLTCDELVVVANRTADKEATIGNQEKLKSLVATGNVRIVQNDREATCDKAEVLPGEDKATLTGNLVIRAIDNSWVQTGQRGTLLRGERRATIDGGPGGRIRLIGAPVKDLGYEKSAPKPAAPATK